MPDQSPRSYGIPVPVADRVFMLWGTDLCGTTIRFLQAFEPGFFQLSAELFSRVSGGRDEQLASTHIRMIRDQAAETLFALLGAAVQSPEGVILWLHRYRNNQLDELIAGFSSGHRIRTHKGTREHTWESIAEEVTCYLPAACQQWRAQFAKTFPVFWRRLADEFTDEWARHEYTSIKHAYRVRSGGSTISITPEKSPGVPDREAKTHVLSGSGFGTSILTPEPIGNLKGHYSLRDRSRNWTPQSLRLQIELISMSIVDTVAYLRVCNGDRSELKLQQPEDDAVFSACWHNVGSLLSSSWGDAIEEHQVHPYTEAELKAKLDSMSTASSPATKLPFGS